MDVDGVRDRARGCLLGQFIGDSLGSLVELRSQASIAAGYPDGVRELADGGTWDLIAGQPTDDSQMAMMLIRSLDELGVFDADDVLRRYVHWYSTGPFDIGGTCAVALSIAVRQVLHVADPVEALVEAVGMGGDTDTNAAIAGALLGAVHGADAWPGQWVSGVLECEPEKGQPGVVNPLGREFWATDLLGQADRLADV